MGDNTGIEWTDATWNPLTGCQAVSPGCDHCYAAKQASGRLKNQPAYEGLAVDGVFTGEVRMLPERLEQPLRWKRPRRIFVNSMSDLFHPAVPPSFIARVFAVMAAAPQHTFQVLTKRPQRMSDLLGSVTWFPGAAEMYAKDYGVSAVPWPLTNVWLGTSIESQRYAFRARQVLHAPATVRFVSAEPLLGPVDLSNYLEPSSSRRIVGDRPRLDWVIVGGESGPGARPMHPDWVRSLRDQCEAAGVAFLFKQAGAVLGAEWGCSDSHGSDSSAWPEDLRIRDYPTDVSAATVAP